MFEEDEIRACHYSIINTNEPGDEAGPHLKTKIRQT